MATTLAHGRKRPVTGDPGSTWFPALEDNVTLDDAHDHDGTDSAQLTSTAFADGAISRVKVAVGTAGHVVINSGAGALSSEATLAKTRGGCAADMSSVTFPSTGTIVTEAGTQTLTNKTWNGVAISETYGGTNQTSYTTGDILYASASNTLSKLAKGTNGQFLKIGASIPEWATVAATLGVKSKAFADSPYTILAGDDLILVDTSGGAVTLNLPASSGGGKVYRVKKTTSDFNAITVARAGADTIQDVSASLTSTLLHTQGEEIMIIDASSGVWQVIDRRIPSITTTYSLTIGAVTSAPTKGTVDKDVATYKRIGDCLHLRYDFKQTGAGSDGTGTYLFPLPTGPTIDTAKAYASTTAPLSVVGNLITSNVADGSSASTNPGIVTVYNSTNLTLWYSAIAANTLTPVSSSTFGLSDAQQGFSYTAIVPISGWNG